MYQFHDSSAAADSGYFVTKSNTHQPTNAPFTATPGDIASVYVHTGLVPSTDVMHFRAYDGSNWSNWDTFNFVSQENAAPVATIADHSLAIGQSTSVASWISYFDADGDPVVMYQFYDAGTAADSDYFITDANSRQPANSPFTAAPGQIAGISVHAGAAAGRDTMYFRAFDGTDWSNWDTFGLTTHV